jgi:hypothetical protein
MSVSAREQASRRWAASVTVALYMDEHIHRAITTGLRLRGVDVLTAQDDGRRQVPDHVLLDRATDCGVFCSRRMKTCWLRQIIGSEREFLLPGSCTRTNYTCPSVLAFANWKSLPKLRAWKTSLTALNTFRYQDCHYHQRSRHE